MGELQLAVLDQLGETEDEWWLLKGGRVLDTGQSGLAQGDDAHV